ncbi:MAG: TetR/AcrR family transcriptional regulator [Bacteroidales bacterium]|nr:MAG: TetR/AcrR family transcriptional regulator [Bacteroidales bacterium]
MIKTKELILGVALKLFLQKNFKEVTMKEIVTKTGMSKGAFYHYFESKEKLFLEVINTFFSSVIDVDFNDYSKESLYRFYTDCNNKLDTLKIDFHEDEKEAEESYFNMNFFFMIFDALKLFPEFREKMEDYHKREIKAWMEVIKKAKENGEIKSSMSDKHIAMIFIYTADGISLDLMLGGSIENLKKEIKSLWDKFYKSLKSNE